MGKNTIKIIVLTIVVLLIGGGIWYYNTTINISNSPYPDDWNDIPDWTESMQNHLRERDPESLQTNSYLSVKIKNPGTETAPLQTGDLIRFSWNNCKSGVNIQLVEYVKNSPHKTNSFNIETFVDADVFSYKISPSIPTSQYRVWVSSEDCDTGEYAPGLVYIENTLEPFIEIISPKLYQPLKEGGVVKIEWATKRGISDSIRLGYRTTYGPERKNIRWITDYIQNTGSYTWEIPEDLMIETWMELLIENKNSEEIVGIVILIK